MKDYYKILGVEENASDETIKKEYRRLSKQYHPDVNPSGGEKFKEIAEAYETLSNPEKRAQYNMSKNNPFNGGDIDSFFKNMFGGGNPFQQNRRQKSAPDKIIKVEITPLESFLGSQKNITYFRNHSCHQCKGTGGDQLACVSCGGSGRQVRTFGTGFMVQQVVVGCETCGGKGFTLTNKCYFCDGRGVRGESSEIKIQLPVGIDDGQFLKLENLGDFSNGQYGDLVIQIVMTKDEKWEKMNNDLIYNLHLGYEDLIRDTYTVPHPNGELTVNAPTSFDTSKPLRLKGKGYNGGDMFIKLFVKFDRTELKK